MNSVSREGNGEVEPLMEGETSGVRLEFPANWICGQCTFHLGKISGSDKVILMAWKPKTCT